MATAYQSAQIVAGKQPRVLPAGYVCQQVNSFLNSTAFIINDTVQMVQLEANPSIVTGFTAAAYGPTITNVKVAMPAMDSSTGFTWVAGDTSSTNRFITTNTTGQSGAGGIVSMGAEAGYAFQPFASVFGGFATYTAVSLVNYTVQIKVTAAASGTPTTGNTIYMEVTYTYDP